MKPPQPLNPYPFLTLYTPTFRRPAQLARCLDSVGKQTRADEVQHLVVPDHVGHGVSAGLFGRLKTYQPAVIGRYVNLLCDDDVLIHETAVATLMEFAEAKDFPAVIVAKVQKGPFTLPMCHPEGEPVCGRVDLTSYIVRGDVWHAHAGDYKLVYEGDYWHALALYRAGHRFAYCDLLWAVGAQSNGRPEY